jgi:hypothetical protein
MRLNLAASLRRASNAMIKNYLLIYGCMLGFLRQSGYVFQTGLELTM